MAQQGPEIIVYSYQLAPNTQKLFQFLWFFGIPYKYVEIPPTLPRPMFTDIGITYRRAPILSIDSDVYVDTSLIISKLSDIAQHRNSGLEDATNHLEFDGLAQEAFFCAAMLIPRNLFFMSDKAFMADRTELMGFDFSPEFFEAARPEWISKTLVLVDQLEGHYLKRGKNQFFNGGSQPSTADMHLYWAMNWGLRYHNGSRPEISEETRPIIFKWLSDVEAFIKPRQDETKMEMSEAVKVIQSPPKHEYAKFVPLATDNPEGFKEGQKIKVTPTDSGTNHPQLGELLGFNYEQVCLRNDHGIVMHFPRKGYSVVAA